MKKTWKKVVSLLMSVMVVFSMMGVPVMAEEAKAAPTEVASCTASGLWTTVLNFAFKDTAWMNAINSVTVNGTVYTNKMISSFEKETNIWDIGSATGAYGSYTALRIVRPDTYPLTVDITAEADHAGDKNNCKLSGCLYSNRSTAADGRKDLQSNCSSCNTRQSYSE